MTTQDWFLVLSNALILIAFLVLLFTHRAPSSDPKVWSHRRAVGHVVDWRRDDGNVSFVVRITDEATMKLISQGVIQGLSLGSYSPGDEKIGIYPIELVEKEK